MDRQQLRFDEFRYEYNFDRPHEALDKKTPSSVYLLSPNRFPEKIREPEYDLGVEVRTVRHNGEFKFKSNHYYSPSFLSEKKSVLSRPMMGNTKSALVSILSACST